MLKRKRFHPDETYDSMVVTYSSDDAVKLDPVHGSGKFECALNNTNSITHTRKLVPLRAHVPNSYDNVTEGQNTLRFGFPDAEPHVLIEAPNNEFLFEYDIEVTSTHAEHTVGDRHWIPAFGWDQAESNRSRYDNQSGLYDPVKIVIPEGRYTPQQLSDALDYAIAEESKADYDRGDGTWLGERDESQTFNQWLTQTDLINSVSPYGWKTIPSNEQSLQLKNVDGKSQFELRNHWTCGHLKLHIFGYIGTSTWPGVVAANDDGRYQPRIVLPGGSNYIQFNQYKRIQMRIATTLAQEALFGIPSDPIWAQEAGDYTLAGAGDVGVFTGTTDAWTLLSNELVIPPGYYSAASLADTIDTLMKASVEPPTFEWLHRIRDYYNGGGQDADTDLRRCEYDASANVFRFYFTPDLDLGVDVPPLNLIDTYNLTDPEDPYGTGSGANPQLVANSSLLRLLGFSDSTSALVLPNNPPMTILQSVSGGCVNMNIPYVYITSPQISRNNVLTSDSRNRNILAAVPMTGVPRCEYAHYTGVDIYVDNIDYKGPTSLDKVEFEVTDDKHNVLTIPTHTPVVVSLKVYHDDTDP